MIFKYFTSTYVKKQYFNTNLNWKKRKGEQTTMLTIIVVAIKILGFVFLTFMSGIAVFFLSVTLKELLDRDLDRKPASNIEIFLLGLLVAMLFSTLALLNVVITWNPG